MITFCVKTQKQYPIVITNGWQDLRFEIGGKKVCIVTDSNVAPLYLDAFKKKFVDNYVCVYQIEAGENSKNAQNYLAILSFLAQNEFTRKDVVIALGGGVVGDLAGFVSATYMRGIDFYQVPTTLLAMIDSSVGGKTAIDLPLGKNLVGAFYQPCGVYINIDTLSTLPKCEIDNGKGELVKYAYLCDSIKDVNNIDSKIIAQCLKIKADIVEKDEKESGLRMLLNLGHTVGHAIETLSSYSIPHGLCVAKGIGIALKISQKFYGFDEEKLNKLQSLLQGTMLDLSIPYGMEEILKCISHDKKAEHESINFVLVNDIGDCRVEKISKKDLATLI